MKRFFLLAFAALALTACNDDSDGAPRFAAENTYKQTVTDMQDLAYPSII